MQAYRLTIVVATAVTTFGFLIGELFPRSIVSLFTNDETLIRLSTTCLRTILISFPVVGFQMVTTTFFQSVGKAAWSIFLSLSRQLIFLIPALIILPRIFGFSGVWAALPTGDILASVLTLIVIVLKMKQFTKVPRELTKETNIQL
ncbi:MAG: MATE family efflux transporter, partial [Bacteroidales bacterium]|nr:MATE family efflux transporter [Bacteroidales bacterium]